MQENGLDLDSGENAKDWVHLVNAIHEVGTEASTEDLGRKLLRAIGEDIRARHSWGSSANLNPPLVYGVTGHKRIFHSS
jgi:hypothetical protein